MLFVLFLLLESLCVSTSSRAQFSESQLKSGCGFVTKRKTIEKAHPCYIRAAANMTPAGATVPGLGPMSLGGWTSKVERCVCMCVLGAVAGYTAHLSRLSFSHMLKANTAICWIGTMCLYVCFIKYIHYAHLLIKTMTGQIKWISWASFITNETKKLQKNSLNHQTFITCSFK